MADAKKAKLTPGEIVIVAAGAVAVVFSFFPWFRVVGGFYFGAWATGLFPLATLVPILGGLMMVQVLVDKLAGATKSRGIGDFTWDQLHLVMAVGAAVVAFCYLIRAREPDTSFGFGFYVDLAATVALVVGAVMIRNERRSATPPA
ncbi:MAG: hypothetical protein ACR2HV_01210 [Acidimicrobiales bacterium]